MFVLAAMPTPAGAPPPGARASASRRVSSDGDDPWSAVDDLRGTKHYDALGLRRDATPAQVRAAYRAAARTHHPDKGGDARAFAAVRAAFETLGDPARRAAYDALAAEHAFRYIPGVTPRARGGEDALLDDLERLGLHLDPGSQLVVLCEVCGRPSNKTCFACGLRFCDFCARKLHWKGAAGLHYPVADAPGSMRRKIAERELERKRVEDARRRQLADPNFRTDDELREIRAFKEAAADAHLRRRGHHTRTYDPRLARYYMWAQTARRVYVAVHVPTGYADRALDVSVLGGATGSLRVQAEDSPPTLHRALARPIDPNAPVAYYRSDDGTRVTVALTKAEPGRRWERAFEGDPYGARCLRAPYVVRETADDVVVETRVPRWVRAEDVRVAVDARGMAVDVAGVMEGLTRTFWRPAKAETRPGDERKYPFVLPEETAWSLDRDGDGVDARSDARSGARRDRDPDPDPDRYEDTATLTICMVKRAPTEDEVRYKRGEVQDNRHASSTANPAGRPGTRLFVEDQDDFGLEDDLAATCFFETGYAWRPAKPWCAHARDTAGRGEWVEDAEVSDEKDLSDESRRVLEQLLALDEEDDAKIDPNVSFEEATWEDDA